MQRQALRFLAGAVVAGFVAGAAVAAVRWTGGEPEPIGPVATATPEPAATPRATPRPTPSATPEDTTGHAAAVVSAHYLATEAGMNILAQGGTAADAAVAVAAMLSIVEPWYSSALGGGTWALYYDAETDAVTSLDGVGHTPGGASLENYRGRAGSSGMHQANTPGAWDGWMLWLDEYGKLGLGDVLEPAITTGREGYAMSAQMKTFLDSNPILSRPATAAIYAPDGALPGEGDTVYQAEMADTFEALADAYREAAGEGRDAGIQAARDYYYRGPIAESLVEFSDANGGYLTLEDFQAFEADIVEPISIDYSDELTVYQNPPNSQGITMLIGLNILRGFDFAGMDANDADGIHAQVEAMKLAFADRHYHVGDPARVDVPVEELLSESHAEAQRARIAPDAAMQWPINDGLELSQPPGTDDSSLTPFGDTTTFHVVDEEGNGAAVTTSLGNQFLVAGETGIHINNRHRFLALDDGDPNQFTPGYKVRHTSNPYLVRRNGELYMLGGNTGADTQAQAQLQQFLNVVEFEMGAQEAVNRPRWVSMSHPSTIYPHAAPNILRMEGHFADDSVAALQQRGHAIQRVEGPTYGHASLIVLGADGTSAAIGAEPRNGTSSGESVPGTR